VGMRAHDTFEVCCIWGWVWVGHNLQGSPGMGRAALLRGVLHR